jgi:hypothetical protein
VTDTTASTAGGFTAATSARIEEGLGTSRYKEYELAPYVQMVTARIPKAMWSGVFFSWLSIKGHLQGLWGFDRSQFFASELPDGYVEAVIVVAWQGAEPLSAWLQHGFSVEQMLREMGIPDRDVNVRLMRDFS